MRRGLCLLLVVCILASVVGCGSKTPVEFSEKLANKRSCYMDVVEVQPVYVDALDYYCRCTLSNGDTVWMSIYEDDYFAYFDTRYQEDPYDKYGSGIAYDAPVRLNGTAKKTDVSDESGNETKTTVFRFVEADAEQTADGTLQRAGAEFADSVLEDRFVYADITRVEFSLFVTSGGSFVQGGVFRCTTTTGDIIAMKIDKEEYTEYFDKSAYFKYDPLGSSAPKTIEFAEPVRVHGVVIRAEAMFTPSDVTIAKNRFLMFTETDKEALENAKLSNQERVEYSDTVKETQNVYVMAKSVTPVYQVSDLVTPSIGALQEYVCRCETMDGKIVWLYMTQATFVSQFSDYTMDGSTVLLNNVQINGSVMAAEDLARDLAEKIESPLVIRFESLGNDQ